MKYLCLVLTLFTAACASPGVPSTVLGSTQKSALQPTVWYGAGDVACQAEYPPSGTWVLSVWPKRTPGQNDPTTDPILRYETLMGNRDQSEAYATFVRHCGPPKVQDWAVVSISR